MNIHLRKFRYIILWAVFLVLAFIGLEVDAFCYPSVRGVCCRNQHWRYKFVFMKLFVIVNVDWFFLSHRLPIALAAQKAGWDVTIVTADTGKMKDIEAKGLKTINLPMSRSGMNIKEELGTMWFLYNLYKQEKPDVVHHVGMKNILWGTLAAKFAKMIGVVNAVSGLGGFFAEDNMCIRFSRLVLMGIYH